MYYNQRYREDREIEEMSGGHVVLIGQDNTRDCLIMSGDVPKRPEMDLGCHGYDRYENDLTQCNPCRITPCLHNPCICTLGSPCHKSHKYLRRCPIPCAASFHGKRPISAITQDLDGPSQIKKIRNNQAAQRTTYTGGPYPVWVVVKWFNVQFRWEIVHYLGNCQAGFSNVRADGWWHQ